MKQKERDVLDKDDDKAIQLFAELGMPKTSLKH